ncbi:MAG TPA: hypothetical protein PKZ24_07125 [Nitrospirales bacterium]|nr:hypothetical protein [Nitrospirales bacterium]
MLKRKSLKAMTGVYVVVEELGPELKGTLSRKDIRTRVEAQLRTAGIRLIKEKEAAKLPGEPYLYVNVATLPVKAKQFACRIDLEVHQLVALVFDAKGGHAITWEQGMLTVGGVDVITKHLDELVFEFICDYLAMNPSV